MGFVVSGLQECKGNVLFSKLGGAGNNFRSGLGNFLEGCPSPDMTPPTLHRGELNVGHNLVMYLDGTIEISIVLSVLASQLGWYMQPLNAQVFSSKWGKKKSCFQ